MANFVWIDGWTDSRNIPYTPSCQRYRTDRNDYFPNRPFWETSLVSAQDTPERSVLDIVNFERIIHWYGRYNFRFEFREVRAKERNSNEKLDS